MSGSSLSDAWRWPPARRRLAQALLQASEPMSGSALGEILGAGTSNVNRHLVALEEAGLVTIRSLDPAEAPPTGRPPRFWELDDAQRGLAEEFLREPPETVRPPSKPPRDPAATRPSRGRAAAPHPETGAHPSSQPRPNGELVIADVGDSKVADLMEVLSHGQHAAKALWTALCGDEVVFAFGGPDPVPDALRMLSFLHDAEVPVRRATIAKVWPRGEFPP